MKSKNKLIEVTKRTVQYQTSINGESQSNAGAIALKDFIIAIDPSPEAFTAPRFREAIEDHFDLPVKYLLVTHSHSDHTRGMTAFKDTTIIGSQQLFFKLQNNRTSVLPEIQFSNKLVIEDDSTSVEFIHAQGHTDCSVYAYSPSEKVLFAGDLIFATYFPWGGDSSCNPDLWIEFYKKALFLEIDYLIPGHGPLSDKSEIKKQLTLLTELKQNTISVIQEKHKIDTIQRPTLYSSGYDNRFRRTRQHFHDFYSKKINY